VVLATMLVGGAGVGCTRGPSLRFTDGTVVTTTITDDGCIEPRERPADGLPVLVTAAGQEDDAVRQTDRVCPDRDVARSARVRSSPPRPEPESALDTGAARPPVQDDADAPGPSDRALPLSAPAGLLPPAAARAAEEALRHPDLDLPCVESHPGRGAIIVGATLAAIGLFVGIATTIAWVHCENTYEEYDYYWGCAHAFAIGGYGASMVGGLASYLAGVTRRSRSRAATGTAGWKPCPSGAEP
jgi:hypothetical protein